MSNDLKVLEPGAWVRVISVVPRQQSPMTTQVEGEVLRVGQQKTGSWYAHSQDKKLWIDRVELRKADGEITHVNLDRCSRVEAIEQPAG